MSLKKGKNNKIAIIGISCWYPGAQNPRQLWENILSRRQQFRRMLDCRLPISDYHDPDQTVPDKTYGTKSAYIDGFSFDWSNMRVPKSTYETTDIVHWLALDVALKALQDAGYSRETISKEKTGVIIGNSLTGEWTRSTTMRLKWPVIERSIREAAKNGDFASEKLDTLIESAEKHFKSLFPPVTEDTLSGALSNTIAGRICNYLDLHGGGYTVDGACSSSLLSVITAANALASGDMDMVFAGGIDISLDSFELIGFAKTKALTRGDMKVYDRGGEGFIPGEGCGFVVLKRLSDAKRDGDQIYAVLNGWGISTDGSGGLTAPNAEGQSRALKRAYERAEYEISTCDFIEGHGTGTTAGDKAELKGIALAHGSNSPIRSCGITSLKSLIGHVKAAAGIGGFIKAVIAVNQRVLPPTAGCSEPNAAFSNEAKCIYPILQGEKRSPKEKIRAGVSAMGFGGINSHVTIESVGKPSDKFTPRISERALMVSNELYELFALSAPSVGIMQKEIRSLMREVNNLSIAELTDLAYDLTRHLSQPNHPVRAGIIANSPESLLKNLEILDEMLDKPPFFGKAVHTPDNNIWLGNNVNKNRVGFLFPGQGSQRINMGRTIVERFEWAQKFLDKTDEYIKNLGYDTVASYVYKELDKASDITEIESWQMDLMRTDIAQPAICLVSALWMKYLDALNIKPVAAAGHSLGELTAFYAAGAYNEKILIQFAAARGKAMAASFEEAGSMASIACSTNEVERLLSGINDYITIANINGPKQTIVSGTKNGVETLIKRATSEGILCKKLNVSNAFHSKFVQNAADETYKMLFVPEMFDNLKIRLFSGIEGKEINPPVKLRDHFASLIVSQVNFIKTIESMRPSCDLFIEVGPGSVLSGLTRSIVEATGESCICLPIESKPGDHHDLKVAIGAMYASGVDINWAELYKNRLVEVYLHPSKRYFLENPAERPFQVIDIGKMIKEEPVVAKDETEKAKTEIPTSGKTETKKEYDEKNIAEILLATIEVQTGFAKESLDMNLGLLDNLNLDSIKSAELITTIMEKFNIVGQLDPMEFSNATLHNIVLALSKLLGSESLKQPQTEKEIINCYDILVNAIVEITDYKKESISANMRLEADLNLDQEKIWQIIKLVSIELKIKPTIDIESVRNHTTDELSKVFERLKTKQGEESKDKVTRLDVPSQFHDNWVRNFSFEYVKSQKPEQNNLTVRHTDSWENSNVLILSETTETEYAQSLKNNLLKYHARVQNTFFDSAIEEKILNASEYSHIILILPLNEGSSKHSTENEIKQMIKRLHLTSQVPLSSKNPRRWTTVAYVQFGGGSFGRKHNVVSIDSCSAKAFASSLHLERPDLRVRVIDVATDVNWDFLSHEIMSELVTPEPFAAIGFDSELNRFVPKATLHSPVNYKKRSLKWTNDDVVIVTGGARGITAECSIAFARNNQVKIALVGSTDINIESSDVQTKTKIAEIKKSLERFEKEGIKANYYNCNLTDAKEVENLIDNIKTFGKITGLIHGAGANNARLVSQTTPESAFKEISPKVMGISNIIYVLGKNNYLKENPLKILVGLSSIIGETGMMGNAWYGFSNEVLDLIIRNFGMSYHETVALSVAYSVWSEVGMGARMGSVENLAKLGIGAIPTEEGVNRFIHLLENDPQTDRVIVTSRLGSLDTWPASETKLPDASRFIEKTLSVMPGLEAISRANLSLEKDKYLIDHNYKGTYLFPIVFGLEAMAQNVAYVLGIKSIDKISIQDIKCERPIPVSKSSEAIIEVYARVLETESDKAGIHVKAGIKTLESGLKQDHFSAIFVLDELQDSPKEKIDFPSKPLDIDMKNEIYGPLLFQGKIFQRIEKYYELTPATGKFTVLMDPLSMDGKTSFSGNIVKPLILGDPFFRDSLLQAGQTVIPKDLCLPVSIEKWEIFKIAYDKQFLAKGFCVLHEKQDKIWPCTILSTDDEDKIIQKIEGYKLFILERLETNPGVEEISQGADKAFWGKFLKTRIDDIAQKNNLLASALAFSRIDNLSTAAVDERHELEKPLIINALNNYYMKASKSFNIDDIIVSWKESGKPLIEGVGDDALDISITHTGDYCLCSISEGPIGCDLEVIADKEKEKWSTLLGQSGSDYFKRLLGKSIPQNVAGTYVWTILESVKKAVNSSNIIVSDFKARDNYLLTELSIDNHKLNIVSLQTRLPNGEDSIFSVTLNSEKQSKEVEILKNSGIKVHTITSSQFMENTYIVFDDNTKEACIIDPGVPCDTINAAIEKLNVKPEFILYTHLHSDHMIGGYETAQKYSIKSYAHKYDMYHLYKDKVKESVIFYKDLPEFTPPKIDEMLNELKEDIKIGKETIKIIETPGHTSGSTTFIIGNNVFTGDTIFKGTFGRTDFPGGDENDILKSIREKLFVLPDDMIVYPGHGKPTTIGNEKTSNKINTESLKISI